MTVSTNTVSAGDKNSQPVNANKKLAHSLSLTVP